MSTLKIQELLDVVLPDERIVRDLRRVASGDNQEVAEITLEGAMVEIPVGALLEFVMKAFFHEYHGYPWGTGFRVQVAIAGSIATNGATWRRPTVSRRSTTTPRSR